MTVQAQDIPGKSAPAAASAAALGLGGGLEHQVAQDAVEAPAAALGEVHAVSVYGEPVTPGYYERRRALACQCCKFEEEAADLRVKVIRRLLREDPFVAGAQELRRTDWHSYFDCPERFEFAFGDLAGFTEDLRQEVEDIKVGKCDKRLAAQLRQIKEEAVKVAAVHPPHWPAEHWERRLVWMLALTGCVHRTPSFSLRAKDEFMERPRSPVAWAAMSPTGIDLRTIASIRSAAKARLLKMLNAPPYRVSQADVDWHHAALSGWRLVRIRLALEPEGAQ
jgi:hypothetical protein